MTPQQRYGPTGKLIFAQGRGITEDGKREEDRYQVVDRVGMEQQTYTIHNGDVISVRRRGRWVDLQCWSDGEQWQFKRLVSQRQIEYSPVQLPARVRIS